jgi:hypothetical protein
MGYITPQQLGSEAALWGVAGGPGASGILGEDVPLDVLDVGLQQVAAFEEFMNENGGECLVEPQVGSIAFIQWRDRDPATGIMTSLFHAAKVIEVKDVFGSPRIVIDADLQGKPMMLSTEDSAIRRFGLITPDAQPEPMAEPVREQAPQVASRLGRGLSGVSMSGGVMDMLPKSTRGRIAVVAITAATASLFGNVTSAAAQTIRSGGLGGKAQVATSQSASSMSRANLVTSEASSTSRTGVQPSDLPGGQGVPSETSSVRIIKDMTVYGEASNLSAETGVPEATVQADIMRLSAPEIARDGGVTDLQTGQGHFLTEPTATSLSLGGQVGQGNVPTGMHDVTIQPNETINGDAQALATRTGHPAGPIITEIEAQPQNAALLAQDGGPRHLQPGQTLVEPTAESPSGSTQSSDTASPPAGQSGDVGQQMVEIGLGKLAAMERRSAITSFGESLAGKRSILAAGTGETVDRGDIVLYLDPATHTYTAARVQSVEGEGASQIILVAGHDPISEHDLVSIGRLPSVGTPPSSTTSPSASVPPSKLPSPIISSEPSPPDFQLPSTAPPIISPTASASPTHDVPHAGHQGVHLHPVPVVGPPPASGLPVFNLNPNAPTGSVVASGTGGDTSPSAVSSPPAHHETQAPSVHSIRESIAQRAILFANNPTDYHNAWQQDAVAQKYAGQSWFEQLNGVSCDELTASSVEAIDPSFPLIDVGDQYNYMVNSPNWDPVNITDPSQLQPGDVLNWGKGNTAGGAAGHTAIAIGHGEMVDASLGGHGPGIEQAYLVDTVYGRPLTVFRYVESGKPIQSAPPAESAPVTSLTGPGFENGVWQSHESGPYTTEMFAVELLKALAANKGVPESDVITPDHIRGLEAWFQLEGGDTNTDNFSYYNLANTGLSGVPGLVSGNSNGSGLMSFKDFNSGITAYILVITGTQPAASYQTRIAQVLLEPHSTDQQVVHAIAYYDETPGNEAWAWGNSPNDPAAVAAYQATYYNSIESMLMGQPGQPGLRTVAGYQAFASEIIGSGQHGENHISSSGLMYNGQGPLSDKIITAWSSGRSGASQQGQHKKPADQHSSNNGVLPSFVVPQVSPAPVSESSPTGSGQTQPTTTASPSSSATGSSSPLPGNQGGANIPGLLPQPTVSAPAADG